MIMNVNIMCPPLPTEGKVMLDYSQTRAPCDFYLPTFLSLPFLGFTSLLAPLHPDNPGFISLHGSGTQQQSLFPRLHLLSVRNLTSRATSFPDFKRCCASGGPPAAPGQPLSVDLVGKDKKAGDAASRTLCSRPASCQ